uniref:RxLR effector candidate protein n=1 Tax=Peronospora matthiolae TaxID=2874970 RepID=A0AAV1VDP9_9STRA
MQVFYLVLVASSAVCAESTASSSTAAHDYQVAVRSFAGDQDSTPPTSLMPSDGTLDDEVRSTTYIDRFVSKLKVVCSKLLEKDRNALHLKLTDGLERSRDGIIKMLQDPRMKTMMAHYTASELVEEILVSFKGVDLVLALAQAQRSRDETIAKIATELLQVQFRSWMADGKDAVKTAFQQLKLGSIKVDEYVYFDWKVIVLDNFITACNNFKYNKMEPIRADGKLVNKEKVVHALTKGFGGVSEFVSVIGGAIVSDGQKPMGAQLSQVLQNVWKDIDKLSPARVVTLMRQEGDQKALSGECLQTLSAYIASYHQMKNTPLSLLVYTLSDGFGDKQHLIDVLSNMPKDGEVFRNWGIREFLSKDAPETSSARETQNRSWRSPLRIG